MTKVIWNSPLEAYVGYTLAEIHALKTHGSRRLNAILDVFHNVHTLVTNIGSSEHLSLRIVPRLIDGVECWVGQSLQKPGLPSNGDIFQNFVDPLLEQIRIDAPQQIVTMAENRLGVRGPITSLHQVARSMGLTRARVYQMLNEINDIMTVRWPLGRHQVYELRDKFAAEACEVPNPPFSSPIPRRRGTVVSRQPPRRGRPLGKSRRNARTRNGPAGSVKQVGQLCSAEPRFLPALF